MNTKLILGSIAVLLLIGSSAKAQRAPLVYAGTGCYNGGYGVPACGYGAITAPVCFGGGYGGYGGGNGSYSRTVTTPNGYSSSTSASYSAPYNSAVNTQAALGGTANIISAGTPIVMGLLQLLGNQQAINAARNQ
jgi:hypothetical protein